MSPTPLHIYTLIPRVPSGPLATISQPLLSHPWFADHSAAPPCPWHANHFDQGRLTIVSHLQLAVDQIALIGAGGVDEDWTSWS